MKLNRIYFLLICKLIFKSNFEIHLFICGISTGNQYIYMYRFWNTTFPSLAYSVLNKTFTLLYYKLLFHKMYICTVGPWIWNLRYMNLWVIFSINIIWSKRDKNPRFLWLIIWITKLYFWIFYLRIRMGINPFRISIDKLKWFELNRYLETWAGRRTVKLDI